ncbi:uncharacterized protein LOC111051974 [Nilaparvata lugens]|uniref:uncharacterized protein LOC111051974 n=1 Tax=Nilaparvata lugens TaxID=108931 RepID=UPI00193E7351|nr:uncharacterized protein LOC111051974 [Nilaparvata lugens]
MGDCSVGDFLLVLLLLAIPHNGRAVLDSPNKPPLVQYSRRNNIRLSGVPEGEGEDVTGAIVSLLNDKLKVGIVPANIDRCHRVSRPIAPAPAGGVSHATDRYSSSL